MSMGQGYSSRRHGPPPHDWVLYIGLGAGLVGVVCFTIVLVAQIVMAVR